MWRPQCVWSPRTVAEPPSREPAPTPIGIGNVSVINKGDLRGKGLSAFCSVNGEANEAEKLQYIFTAASPQILATHPSNTTCTVQEARIPTTAVQYSHTKATTKKQEETDRNMHACRACV